MEMSKREKYETLQGPANRTKDKIRVTAPGYLPEGYAFEAHYTLPDGEEIAFEATVPKGGVSQNEVFLVNIPENFPELEEEIEVPIGKWKDGLCDCFNISACHPSNLWGFCAQPVLLDQVMQRMRLSACGNLLSSKQMRTCRWTMSTFFFLYIVFKYQVNSFIMDDGSDEEEVQVAQILYIVVTSCFLIYFLIAKVNTRRNIRKTYSIPGSGCEDCILSAFCSCCVVTQMARHTGEYEKYPGECCTGTGLNDKAPMLIV